MGEILKEIPKGRSIKALRLNMEVAASGKTWRLLPLGFRTIEAAKTYPLPRTRSELQRLISIVIPPGPHVDDSGALYIKRAMSKWRELESRRVSAVIDVSHRADQVAKASQDFDQQTEAMKAQAQRAVDGVLEEAKLATASLKDLFALGRKGIKGQMQAHIDNEEWQDEKITAHAFRQCFAMVTGAVKGLGMPSDQKSSAKEAIIEEAAEAIRSSREALELAPGTDPEIEH